MKIEVEYKVLLSVEGEEDTAKVAINISPKNCNVPLSVMYRPDGEMTSLHAQVQFLFARQLLLGSSLTLIHYGVPKETIVEHVKRMVERFDSEIAKVITDSKKGQN